MLVEEAESELISNSRDRLQVIDDLSAIVASVIQENRYGGDEQTNVGLQDLERTQQILGASPRIRLNPKGTYLPLQ